jgi:hypothetical protein
VKPFSRFVFALVGLLSLALATASGQAASDNQAAQIAKSAKPGYVRVEPRAIDRGQGSQAGVAQGTTLVFPAGATSSRAIFARGDRGLSKPAGANDNQARDNSGDRSSEGGKSPREGTIDGLNTVPTFSGAFFAQGTLFPFIMMGNHPLAGGTTVIPDKVSEISLQLLNADGRVNKNMPFAPFEDLAFDSPNFAETDYRSGRHIQFADAVQRAEFFNRTGGDWHTVLDPGVVKHVTLTVPRFVNVTLPDGTVKQVDAYFLGTAADGHPFVFVLDMLFVNLVFNEAVNEINEGLFTTNALNTALLPNTFLFSIDSQGNFSQCCIIGFHTFFFDPSTNPENIWIFAFASWTSPGIFGGFVDVTALSHEISESFNDPLLSNSTPSWQFPGSTTCQSNLETGDPVEVLPNDTVSITLREGHEVFTFHPQTEALLQWFEMGSSSNAIDGAFSFPNETVLVHSALPCQ